MSGTTLCPHCDTRFKIAEAQLAAHHGMVRCGHCLQAFDARPSYTPDQPNPQLELPILDEPVAPAEELPADKPHAAEAALAIEESWSVKEAASAEETELVEAIAPADEAAAAETEPPETPRDNLLDFNQPAADEPESETPPVAPNGHGKDAAPENETRHARFPHPNPLPQAGEGANESLREFHVNAADEPNTQTLTLAEQVAIVRDEDNSETLFKQRTWPWSIAAILLLLVLLAQTTYFFRVEIAARLPSLKPSFIGYCQLLKCTVPLPQKPDLIGIESSDLEADPAHENQITLNALLRNRAPYAQSFPDLELTLNDIQDKPLARRIFRPTDYLPSTENEKTGLQPNHEFGIKLHLNTTDLKPTGYRLALFYPQQ